MIKIKMFLGVLVMIAFFTNCEYTPIIEPDITLPESVSFSVDIEPIFVDQACIGCHKDNFKPVLTSGDAYVSLMADPAYVVVDNPESSEIYTKPSPDGGHPKKYTNAQAALVLKWIEQGAKNN